GRPSVRRAGPRRSGITSKNVTRGQYAPERGTIVQHGRYTRLLATNGPTLLKRGSSPLPHPAADSAVQGVHLSRSWVFERAGPEVHLAVVAVHTARKPAVSVYYSELIAGLLALLRNVRDWSPATLNIKLRASRWFL